MKIYLATDHAGFRLKEFIKQKLTDKGYAVSDCGAYDVDEDDDYPDFVEKAAKAVSKNKDARAIILGKTGQGEAVVANREKGVRAAVYYGGPLDIITLSREHNNANVLSLGAGFLTEEEAWQAVSVWLDTQFSGVPRHIRRIQKTDD